MEICPHEKCTGCYACASVCPHDCITMQEDGLGEVHPNINSDKCTQCLLCQKICPNNRALDFRYPSTCYASWTSDIEKRKICASGGIGTTMSEYVISKAGGVVFGSRYDEHLVPIMTYTESLDELKHFKGSRYVQSVVGNETFKQVRRFLLDNREVLFIGTPCQIAGLKSFLRKDYQNLITVDLICHGVCPTKYFIDELSYLSNKFKLFDVADARFRGNDGNNYREKFLRLSEAQQFYITGFLMGVSLRENCYSCPYARPERISDITIGDFIGLGKKEAFDYPKANVSSVTINTDKGNEFYNSVSASNESLMNIKRKYEERLCYKPSLVEPFPRHQFRDRFVDLYRKHGYVVSIRKTLFSTLIKRQIMWYLHCWTYVYRIPRKAYKILKGHIEK